MKKLNRISITITILLAFLISGCDFGDDKGTTSPSKIEINKCETIMNLNPSVKITPLGFKFENSVIDDVIWFKFKTTAKLEDIFNDKTINTSKFEDNFTFTYDMSEVKWWNTKGKKFLGGQVNLPNAKYMNVGIQKSDDGYVVYIKWYET